MGLICTPFGQCSVGALRPQCTRRDNADLGPPTITGCCAAVNGLQIVRLAQHPIVEQRKLLAGGQLTAARVAREARQMEDQLAGASHPIGRGYAAAALRAFRTEVSVGRGRKGVLLFVCGESTQARSMLKVTAQGVKCVIFDSSNRE